MNAISDVVLDYFEQLSLIPRCSGNEEPIRRWLQAWAAQHQWNAQCDVVGNLRIDVPAAPGCEHAPLLVIQGHLDMVCEQTLQARHDFKQQGLRLYYEGEWLRAEGTTLGADNGVAIAIAMAIAEHPTVRRPPLELLFTVDEETGLHGALGLQADFIQGRCLLNIDSEEDGVFIVGCAGGQETTFDLPVTWAETASTEQAVEITVGGLRGGHSGIEIHRNLGNAIVIISSVLAAFPQARLIDLQGGSAHNVIPRDAKARIIVDSQTYFNLGYVVETLQNQWQEQLGEQESGLRIAWAESSLPAQAATVDVTQRVVGLLQSIPHGVVRYLPTQPDIVETSTNLAMVNTKQNQVHILTSQRSANADALLDLTAKLRTLDESAQTNKGYPGWQPNWDSPLLATGQQVFERLFGHLPKIAVIHAGLECGVIGDKIPGMDILSCGPTIVGAHSPGEKLHLPSLERIYRLVLALAEALVCQKPESP